MKYKRILLKLSGESLAGTRTGGLDADRLHYFAAEIREVVKRDVRVSIVIGGGNIFRGLKGNEEGIRRVQGDYMGMLATVINGLALQDFLEKYEVRSKVLTAFAIETVSESISSRRIEQHLSKGEVVILCGGTGSPFFTTDSAAALRAIEMEAEVLLKGTRVDGVYSADPEKDKSAVKYDEITFGEAYGKGLEIMDLTAFTLCRENNLPVIVFNMNIPGNLLKVVEGARVGTLVKP